MIMTWMTTNFFRVKEPSDFEDWVESWEGGNLSFDEEKGYYRVYGPYLPSVRERTLQEIKQLDPDHEVFDPDYREADFVEELAGFLEGDSVALVYSASVDGETSIDADVVAVNAEGKRVWIALDEIFDLARELGTAVKYAPPSEGPEEGVD